jgi:hypothetical protein
MPPDEIIDNDRWEDPDIMSAKDWTLAGHQPGQPSRQLFRAVDRVFKLLGRDSGQLFPQLVMESRILIAQCGETRL